MKKQTNWLMWGIVILLIIIIFKSNPVNTQINSQSQFVEKEKEGTSLGSNLGTTQKSNLCNLITPYVFVFNLQDLCNSNGGTWVCNQNNIGCYNLESSTINCNLAVVQTALYQCRAATGIDYCDTKTVSCKY